MMAFGVTELGNGNATEKQGPGAPKGNANAKKSRYYGLKLKLTDVSLATISRQNGIGKAVAQKAQAIMTDRGGRETLSELQLDLVDRYVKTELLIHGIDQWLFAQKSLINRRRKSAYPILAERNRLVEVSLKLASAIGLERRAKPVPDLAAYLASKRAPEPASLASEATEGEAE